MGVFFLGSVQARMASRSSPQRHRGSLFREPERLNHSVFSRVHSEAFLSSLVNADLGLGGSRNLLCALLSVSSQCTAQCWALQGATGTDGCRGRPWAGGSPRAPCTEGFLPTPGGCRPPSLMDRKPRHGRQGETTRPGSPSGACQSWVCASPSPESWAGMLRVSPLCVPSHF